VTWTRIAPGAGSVKLCSVTAPAVIVMFADAGVAAVRPSLFARTT
jgi:hypothetical protein